MYRTSIILFFIIYTLKVEVEDNRNNRYTITQSFDHIPTKQDSVYFFTTYVSEAVTKIIDSTMRSGKEKKLPLFRPRIKRIINQK